MNPSEFYTLHFLSPLNLAREIARHHPHATTAVTVDARGAITYTTTEYKETVCVVVYDDLPRDQNATMRAAAGQTCAPGLCWWLGIEDAILAHKRTLLAILATQWRRSGEPETRDAVEDAGFWTFKEHGFIVHKGANPDAAQRALSKLGLNE